MPDVASRIPHCTASGAACPWYLTDLPPPHSYARYSSAERAVHRDAFYQKYLAPDVVWDTEEEDDPEIEAALGAAPGFGV